VALELRLLEGMDAREGVLLFRLVHGLDELLVGAEGAGRVAGG
jgi:hypothetical protein